MIVVFWGVVAVAVAVACYQAFRYGYNLGWDERHKSMTLPRNYPRTTTVIFHDPALWDEVAE